MICEGAGSPAEINLRDGDFVNMGLARHAGLPGDRGRRHRPRRGVRRAVRHRGAARRRRTRRWSAGFVINKFRGDLGPAAARARHAAPRSTGRPVYGVLPFHLDLWLDAEDSLAYGRVLGRPGAAARHRVAAGRGGPAAADLQRHRRRGAGHRAGRAGAADRRAGRDRRRRPGRAARLARPPWTTWPGCARPAWPTRCRTHAAAGQAAARHLRRLPDARPSASTTRWRAAAARVPGWGCCRSRSRSAPRKTLARSAGHGARRGRCAGYEIHHGYVSGRRAASRCCTTPTAGRRARSPGNVFGTHWHGAFESDEFRRAFLTEAARLAGRHGFRGRAGHPVRRGPRARPRRARRPGRGAPRHRRAVAAHRAAARRPACRSSRPARRRMTSRRRFAELGRRASRAGRRASAPCGWSPSTGRAARARRRSPAGSAKALERRRSCTPTTCSTAGTTSSPSGRGWRSRCSSRCGTGGRRRYRRYHWHRAGVRRTPGARRACSGRAAGRGQLRARA